MASGSAQMSDADYFNYISAAILQAKKLDTSEEAYGKSMREFDKLFDYSCSMLRNFPRDERHLTRDDIRKTLAAIRDNLVLVWKSYYKKNTLETIDKLLAVLRVQISFSCRNNYITTRQEGIWVSHVDNVNAYIKGWKELIKANPVAQLYT